MKSSKWINEKEFESIKALQAASVRPSVTVRATSRSIATINRIYRSETFEDYRLLTKIKNGYTKSEPVQEPVEKLEKGVDYLTESRNTVILNRIATALERMADAWEQSPKKRTLF